MRVLVCVCAITALAVPAVAQTYPFEGRWQQGGNGCHQADVFTAREIRSPGSGGACRFTRVAAVDATTYRYEARCEDDTGAYSNLGDDPDDRSGPHDPAGPAHAGAGHRLCPLLIAAFGKLVQRFGLSTVRLPSIGRCAAAGGLRSTDPGDIGRGPP